VRVDILKKTEHLTKNNKPYWRVLLQAYNETGTPQNEPQSYALFDYIAGQKLEVGESWNCDLSSTINPAGGLFNNLDTVNSRLDPAPSSAPSPASPAAVAPTAPPLGGTPTATTSTIEPLWNELPAHSGGRVGMTGQNLSIEHQVALKEARLAAEFVLSKINLLGATADVPEYLRTWNLMYMGARKMLNGQAKDLLRELLAKQAPPPPPPGEEEEGIEFADQELGG